VAQAGNDAANNEGGKRMNEDPKKVESPVSDDRPAAPEAPARSGLIGVNRRDLLRGVGVGGLAAGFGGATYLRGLELGKLKAMAQEGGPVKLGFIEDESGNLAVYGLQKLHAAQLAVKEINEGKTLKGAPNIGAGMLGVMGNVAGRPPVISKDGTALDVVDDGGERSTSDLVFDEDDDILIDSGEQGVLGRELQLLSVDGQSNNAVWQQLARRLIQQDQVDVLVAGFASAEREAIRPIVDQFSQLYFYTNQYEGGVADANTFCTGPVCEQQVIPTVQYMVENFGPRCFTIAADYNFGQLTAAWTRAFIPLVGGEIVAEEFVPLSVSEFSQVIARVQQANPDWVMTLLVGQNHHNYYPQASTVNMAQGYEHKRFPAPSMANMHNAIQYQMEVPTGRNRAFVKRWMEMFPDDEYIGEMAQNTYFTIHLYAKAARLAGTTDQETVRRALELGWNIEAPEGGVFLEPGTHHCAHPIRLAHCDENHDVSFLRDWPMIQAWWLQRLGVNLVRNPEYKQYVPDEDPYFTMFG
jgi:branched-chain amino acid transport system substrate-binding protein